MKKIYALIITLFFCSISFAQNDTAKMSAVYEKIMSQVKDFRPDTSNAPNDKVTHAIIRLRRVKGGFNINEALHVKLAEARQKNEISADEYNKASYFFTQGDGKRWLDNAAIWIYRNKFTYKELKKLVKFYKSPAGQKMSEQYPVIMLQALAAGEMIKNMLPAKK